MSTQRAAGVEVRSTPKAEVNVTPDLVRELLASQHPELAHLPIRQFESGWDNVMFRLGEQYLVRLPRRKIAAKYIRYEQRWLPQIADSLSLPTPVTLRIGHPTNDYPWFWSVLPWLQGQAADQSHPSPDQWQAWVDFLRSLHRDPPPVDAPVNPSRGLPLPQRADAVWPRLQRLRENTQCITGKILAIWEQSIETEGYVPDTWVHGDLHQRNVLLHNGRFSAVIDWGDICKGDPANDLASLWTQLPSCEDRRQAQDALSEISEATWCRAKGWAVFFATLLLDTGLVDNPRHAAMGRAIFQYLQDDLAAG